MQVPELSQVSTSSGHNCHDYYRDELGDQLGTNRIHVLTNIIIMLITMLIRAGMELGQVLSEEQRKERFSSCLRRKRAAQEVIMMITIIMMI